MGFTTKTCEEFVDVLASKAPVPGGGGASALVGAIGMALGNMVGSLTVGKKKYADVEADIIEEFAAKGSALAISDAGVGVTFCKAALLGASLNVFINTKSMADKEYAASLNEKADKMIADYSKKADEIFAAVNARLR